MTEIVHEITMASLRAAEGMLIMTAVALAFMLGILACGGIAWLFGADVSFREDNDL